MKDFNYQECINKHNGFAVDGAGDPHRLLCDKGENKEYPVIAVDIYGEPEIYTAQGAHSISNRSTEQDLFTPTKEFSYERWVNIYTQGPAGYFCITEHAAIERRDTNCIATIKITIEGEEGEGL